jgi:outer membrane protein
MEWKKLKTNAVILSLCLCVLSWSMPVGAAGEIKIGVVNAAKVLELAPQAEAARKRLEAEFAPRDKTISESQKELRKNEELMERDAQTMSETQRQKLDRDIVAQRRDVKRAQEEFRDDLNVRRNEEFSKLQKRIADVILSVAKDSGYDLVLTDGVLYASDKVDLTEVVLQRLSAIDKEGGKPYAPGKAPAN